MGNILDQIFASKRDEVSAAKRQQPLSEMRARAAQQAPPLDAVAALRGNGTKNTRIIAEVKRRTPFKGELRPDFDPLKIAAAYVENGAAALSVLTDERYFGGSLQVFADIRARVRIPLLRKDFIFAEYQIYEARAVGADMFLLIATSLEKNQIADLMALGLELGMAALVETHHEQDLERAFCAGATLIGINNRDLGSGKTDLGISRRLLKMAVCDARNVAVCESGIHSRKEIEELGALGAHAFLIGESLVKAADTGGKLKEFLGESENAPAR